MRRIMPKASQVFQRRLLRFRDFARDMLTFRAGLDMCQGNEQSDAKVGHGRLGRTRQ